MENTQGLRNGFRLSSGGAGRACLLTALALTALAGCTRGLETNDDLTAESLLKEGVGLSAFNVNKNPLHKTVCDPFGGQEGADPQKGVKASLYYQSPGAERLSSAQAYVDRATKSSQTLFFNDLFVPTRMFSEGFSSQTSSVVKDDAGNKLIEYFGMKFETVLRLRPEDPEGDYELGVLSDDGVILKALINNEWKTLINNDGDHPTRMGCTQTLVHMTRDTVLPIELVYYQGPRYHIANILLWKISASDVVGRDARCDQQGNNLFHDPDAGSVERPAYKDLLARGWSPVHADNFYLQPEADAYNPCQEAVGPVVSAFKVDEVLARDVYVSWKTDVPATSQVLVTTVSTGEQRLTESDLVLRTSNSIRVSGLSPATEYRIQAVSIGGDLGRTMSEPVVVTTSR